LRPVWRRSGISFTAEADLGQAPDQERQGAPGPHRNQRWPDLLGL